MSKLDEKQVEQAHKSAAVQKDKAFEEWVSQSVLDETAEMVNGLENDPDLDDFEPSEELFQKIVGIANERGLLAEEETDDVHMDKIDLSDKEQVKVQTELCSEQRINNTSYRKLHRYSSQRHVIIKWVAMITVTLLGVFGVSMSSQANRTFVMQKMDELFGDNVNTKVNTTDDVMGNDIKEDDERKNIESAFGIKLPILFYLPDEMVYTGYSIDKEAQTAYMEYKLGNESIFLLIFANYKNSSGIYENDQGNMLEHVENDLVDISAELWKIEDEGDKSPTYIVQWDYKNTYYEIMGKIDLDEIKNIFQNIVY